LFLFFLIKNNFILLVYSIYIFTQITKRYFYAIIQSSLLLFAEVDDDELFVLFSEDKFSEDKFSEDNVMGIGGDTVEEIGVSVEDETVDVDTMDEEDESDERSIG